MNLPDCDCVQLLDGVFEDDDHQPAGISTSKEKLHDYISQQDFFIPQPSPQLKISGTSSTWPAINNGYITTIPRPPIF